MCVQNFKITLHTFLISLARGSMVLGPLPQFTPTTAAPASSRRRHASGIGTSSVVISGQYGVMVITAGTPENRGKMHCKLGL